MHLDRVVDARLVLGVHMKDTGANGVDADADASQIVGSNTRHIVLLDGTVASNPTVGRQRRLHANDDVWPGSAAINAVDEWSLRDAIERQKIGNP